jgi:hypothetical protein
VAGVAKPVVISLVAGVAIAYVLRPRPSGPDPELPVGGHERGPSPPLFEVRLDERDAGVLLEYGVTVIPGVTVIELRPGRGEPSHPAARCDAAVAGDADALK